MTTLRLVFASFLASFSIAHAATVAGVTVPPPLPAKPVVDTHHGVAVSDPYRFLEDVKDPTVQQWLRGQADATTAILAKMSGRAPLLARMQAIEAAAAGLTNDVVRTEGNRYFFLRRNPGDGQFKLIWRDGIEGADTVIVDPEALSKAAGRPHAIMDFAPSRDGRLLAYSMQVGGGEIGTLQVVEVATGNPLIEPIDRIRYAGTSWLDDSSGFFYSRLVEGYEKSPPGERFRDRTRHFRALDTSGTDRPIFSPSRNPELKLPSYASAFIFQLPGTQTAAAMVYLGVERNRMLFLADLTSAIRGDAKWRKVVDLGDQVSNVAYTNGWLYLRSAIDAPRYKLLRMPLADPNIAKAETVIAPGRSVIVNIAGARDGLYVTQRDGATLSLARFAPAAGATQRAEPIALPFAGNVGIDSASPRLDGVVLELGGWTHAARPWLYEAGKLAQLPFVKPGAYDAPADIEAREVRVKGLDGVEIPMSILMRKDLKLDGRNPTIVYGYGAYGTTEDPFFNPRIYAWLERGGVYAFVHVRGSGVYGDEWHQAGRKTTKPNTWRDAIAATDWLIAQRYTSTGRVAVFGGSAGGILVGRAITERPDLFAAAISEVGTMDMLRAETSANGAANVPEFGTVAKEDEFRALLAMSSYHQLKDGAKYPAVLLIHGVNDIRVDVWQSAKFASRMAAVSGSAKPVLMRLDYESGHGQGSTRTQLQERAADRYSFLLWQFGEPEFQPRADGPAAAAR